MQLMVFHAGSNEKPSWTLSYFFEIGLSVETGEKQTHSDQPIVSDSVIDLTSIGSYGGGASMAAKLIKAHGMLINGLNWNFYN